MKTGQFPNLLDTMPHTLCSLSYPATPREKANIESLFHYKNISYLKKKNCFQYIYIRVPSQEIDYT